MKFVHEIKRKVMQINLYGVDHEVRFPTWEEVEEYEDKITKCETTKEVIQHMRSYLEMLGLSADVTKKIDSIDVKNLIRFIQDPEGNAKKN